MKNESMMSPEPAAVEPLDDHHLSAVSGGRRRRSGIVCLPSPISGEAPSTEHPTEIEILSY